MRIEQVKSFSAFAHLREADRLRSDQSHQLGVVRVRPKLSKDFLRSGVAMQSSQDNGAIAKNDTSIEGASVLPPKRQGRIVALQSLSEFPGISKAIPDLVKQMRANRPTRLSWRKAIARLYAQRLARPSSGVHDLTPLSRSESK